MDTLNQLFSDKLTSALYVQGENNLPATEYANWIYDVINNIIGILFVLCVLMIIIGQFFLSKNKEKIGKSILIIATIPGVIATILTLYMLFNSKKIDEELVYNPIVSVRGVNSEQIDFYRSFNAPNYTTTQKFLKSEFLSATANKFPITDKQSNDGEIFCGVVLRPKDMNKNPIILNLMSFENLEINGCKKDDPIIDSR